MKNHDSWSSLVWLGFAGWICVESLRLPLGSWGDPGPGLLPLGSGMGLAGFSLLHLAQNCRKPGAAEELLFTREGRRPLLVLAAVLSGYTIGLVTLGFLLSTFLFFLLLLRLIQPQKWLWTVGGSALTSAAAYLLFELWLRVPLPRGILRF